MKATFESEDQIEINRLSKSLDMALVLLHIKELLYKDKVNIKKEIVNLYEEYGIDLEGLLE